GGVKTCTTSPPASTKPFSVEYVARIPNRSATARARAGSTSVTPTISTFGTRRRAAREIRRSARRRSVRHESSSSCAHAHGRLLRYARLPSVWPAIPHISAHRHRARAEPGSVRLVGGVRPAPQQPGIEREQPLGPRVYRE